VVETAVEVTVVVVPVEVAYRNARTPTTIISATITAIATREKLLFPVLMPKFGSAGHYITVYMVCR
jgi:hypothetical protein